MFGQSLVVKKATESVLRELGASEELAGRIATHIGDGAAIRAMELAGSEKGTMVFEDVKEHVQSDELKGIIG